MVDSLQLMDKSQIQKLEAQVSEILWEAWDPIGLNDDLAQRDEYEDYVAAVVEQVIRGLPEAKLTEFLHRIAIEQMHVRRWAAAQRAAKRLLQLIAD